MFCHGLPTLQTQNLTVDNINFGQITIEFTITTQK